MSEVTSPQRRVRIEVSTSVKGVKTYSWTVELVDQDHDIAIDLVAETLAESDRLVALLDTRYPPQTG